MFSVKSYTNIHFAKHNLIICVLKQNFMKVSTSSNTWNKTRTKSNTSNENNSLETLIAKYEPKLLYNSVIEGRKMKLGYQKNNIRMLQIMRYQEKLKNKLATIQPLPLSLKYLSDGNESIEVKDLSGDKNEPVLEKLTQFPYNFMKSDSMMNESEVIDRGDTTNDRINSIGDEIVQRNKLYKDTNDWMTAYDNFENDLVDEVERNDEINYGTPDPNSEISNVPCGGCGALLHCKVYYVIILSKSQHFPVKIKKYVVYQKFVVFMSV